MIKKETQNCKQCPAALVKVVSTSHSQSPLLC